MDTLSLRFVFDRKKLSNDTDSQGLLQIEIREVGTSNKVFISTGIKLLKNQYSKKNRKIVQHPNAVSYNGKANRIFRDIEAYSLSNKCKVLQDIKNWDTKEESNLSVISFIDSELKRRNPSLSVISVNQTLIKQIESFGKFKTFSDFTYNNVMEFDNHLKYCGLAEPTAYKRHSLLRGYIREAINRGYCTYDPYMTFRPKRGASTDPVYLEEYELQAIKKCDIYKKTGSDRLVKIRDLFVFQCYTGLAYVDLMAFKKEDISEIDGQKVIRSNRQKTEQGFITVLLPEAMEILEKYNYELPRISNQKYNDYLKLLAVHVIDEKTKEAIIKKRLTTHVARHTCGTYLLNKGVPIETVSRMLGHSNTKMTQHYAKLLGKTIVKDVLTHVIKKELPKDNS